jgi:Arc/MetJ-type ribon-helix-helix transcriptional regulator
VSTDVSPENERYIQSLIERGSFRDRAEVLDAGVGLLRLRGELLERIDEGRRQLNEGEYTDYDDTSLSQRFRELKETARKAAEHHG